MCARGRIRKMATPGIIAVLAALALATSMSRPAPTVPLPVSAAFSFASVTHRHQTTVSEIRMQRAPTRIVCRAKLNKVASAFDLDELLSNEKEFDAADGETPPSSSSKHRGRRKNTNKEKKLRMKEEMKQRKLERQKVQRRMKRQSGTDDGSNLQADNNRDEDDLGGSLDVDYQNLIRTIDFLACKIPARLDGKRIDAALAKLLNKDDDESNSIAISRSQCGTLLSHECVFIVPPDGAEEFLSSWEALREAGAGEEGAVVPRSLIEQFGSPMQRKSHALEPSSVLLYPSRQSLLSSSSSALLSNFMPPMEIIAQKIPLDILFEDEHMIVLNKQAGMVVHPAAGNWDGTMVNALAHYLTNESPFGAGELFGDGPKGAEESLDPNANAARGDANQNDAVTNSISALRPGIVHRLDKGTTGVLVVAKTSSALATLSEAFADRKVKKQYLAVAIGNPGEDRWIDKPIGRHPTHRQRMRVVPDPSASANGGRPRLTGPRLTAAAKRGRSALSRIHTVHFDGKLSVVRVEIATGRTHQIRVHLQDHGTPVYGDDVYGLSDWNRALTSRRGITRPLLHAQRLEIDHPVTGENMIFEAPVANDMMGVIKAIWPVGVNMEF